MSTLNLDALGPAPKKVSFEQVTSAAALIDNSGVVAKVETFRAEMKKGPGGRRATVNDRTILTLLLLLAMNHEPLHLTRATRLVRETLDDANRRYLGLQGFERKGEEVVYHRLARAVQRLVAAIDPYPGPKRRRLTYAEYEALLASRLPEDEEALNTVLHELMNDLVFATVDAGREFYEHFDGNYAVDGTFIKAGGRRGTDFRNGTFVNSEYDGGRYYRAGDHTPSDLKNQKRSAKNWWGYEGTFVVMTNNLTRPTAKARFTSVPAEEVPHLIAGIGFHAPAEQPGQNALHAFRHLPVRDMPVNLAVADRAYYAGAAVENFHYEMADMGFKPVTDYKNTDFGVTDNYEGALQVEGTWYCPSMPPALINATIDFKNGDIDETTYHQRIEARRKYAAVRKTRPNAKGTYRISHPEHLGHRCKGEDKFCTSKSISVPREAGLKHAQEFPYASKEWTEAYGNRNTVESANAGLKDPNTHDLGSSARRRLRGRTAQFLLTTVAVMARNIEVLRAFKNKVTNTELAARIARKKALRRPLPFNFRSMNDTDRELALAGLPLRT